MKKYIIIALSLFSSAHAVQVIPSRGCNNYYTYQQQPQVQHKYNPYSQRWETVPNDWQTKYNPYEGTWSYQPNDAITVYNPYEGTWDWNSGHGN